MATVSAADLVLSRRKALGLDIVDVAKRAGLDVDTITDMEDGDMTFPGDWHKLANSLDLSYIELMILDGFLTAEDVDRWVRSKQNGIQPADRTRAESIVETIVASTSAGIGSAGDAKQAADLAERLEVPVALIWLATDHMSVEQIDELCAWWPRKESA